MACAVLPCGERCDVLRQLHEAGRRLLRTSSERRSLAVELAQAGGNEGLASKLLVRQEGGFSILLLQAKPGFIVPRHRHDTDCMYYVQSGALRMGRRTLQGGDAFFVPAGVVYTYEAGPEGCEVLEIRFGVERYATDFPSVSLSFSEAGTTRVIRHYLGCENPPPALTAFEQQVDAVAGVDEWVKGYAER